MPLFMDVHERMQGIDGEKVAMAHKKDMELQDKHGVKFLRYWYDDKAGKVFCLSEAPDAESAQAVHKEAGHPADAIYRVKEGS